MNKNIIHPATCKKIEGYIQVNQTTRKLSFKANTFEVELSTSEIKNIEKKPYKEKELLYIVDVQNNAYVFGFFGEGKKFFCNFYHDILKATSIKDFQKKQFEMLPTIDKKKITLLLNDNYLKMMFDSVVIKHQILNLNNFWFFMRKFHPERFSINLLELKIQPTRKDEIMLKNSGKIKFNFNLKNKILSSYEDVNTIFMHNTQALKQSDHFFWSDFLKSQTSFQSELVGGLNKIYIDNKNSKYLEEYKAKNKIKNKSEEGNDFFKDGYSNNRFEFLEMQNNFINDYSTHLVNAIEMEYSDLIRYRHDALEKKETSNIITSLNDYSMRKLETLNYMPKDGFTLYLNKEKNKMNKMNISINNKYKTILNENNSPYSADNNSLIIIGDDIEMKNDFLDVNISNKSPSNISVHASSRIEEMLIEHNLKESKINSTGSYRTMQILNKRFEKIAKNKESSEIPNKIGNNNTQERVLTNRLLDYSSLLRDLKSLHDIAKDKKEMFTDSSKKGIDDATRETIKFLNKKRGDISLNAYQKEQIDLILSLFE